MKRGGGIRGYRPQPLLFLQHLLPAPIFWWKNKDCTPPLNQLALSLEGPQAVHPGIKMHSLKARCECTFGQSQCRGDLQVACGRSAQRGPACMCGCGPSFRLRGACSTAWETAPWFLFN